MRRLVAETAGLVVVAGLDSRPGGDSPGDTTDPFHFLPSGRSTIFRVLVSEALDAQPRARCLVVAADRGAINVARRFRNRIELIEVKPSFGYAEAIAAALAKRPDLLVVDRLAADNLPDVYKRQDSPCPACCWPPWCPFSRTLACRPVT